MHWLHPILGGTAARYVLLLLAVITVAGFAANAPRRWAGPITRAERSSTTVRARVEGWARLALAVAAWIAILLVIAPISCSQVAVLHSRARSPGDPVRWDVRQRWDGGACAPTGDDAVDLGPQVDSALQAITLSTASPSEQTRAEIRAEILATPLASPVAVMGTPTGPQSTPSRRMPAWLIESVEMSTALAFVENHNVQQLRIAPAATHELSAWRALGATLAARGVELCLVSPTVLDDEVRIRRLAFARWFQAGPGKSHVELWALVTGRIKEKTTLRLKIDRAEPLTLDVPPDANTGRLIFVCVGECSRDTAGVHIPDAGVASIDKSPTTVAAIEANNQVGVVASIAPAKASVTRPPYLAISDPATLQWWRALLDGDDAQFNRPELQAELVALGWQLPTTKLSGPDTNPIRLAEESGRIVIWRGELRTPPGQASVVAPARVVEAQLGVNTSYSMLALPVTQKQAPNPLAPNTAEVSAGVQTAAADAKPASVKPQYGIVGFYRADHARIATIALDPRETASDPIALAALVRAVAYAAAWIVDPEFDETMSTDERDSNPFDAGPVLRDEDLFALRAKEAFGWDAIAIALLGLHLWLAFRGTRR